MDELIKVKDRFDTELERQIDFALKLHFVVSAYDAKQVFDYDPWWGYFLGNSVINFSLIDGNNLDWELQFEVIDKEKENKLIRNVLVNRLDPGDYPLENFGYVRFRIFPNGDSRWEVVGSTVPTYGGTQARDPKVFSLDVDPYDLL